jgi:1,2-diacylglycerol 3-alpha-glucosyltransferase
MHCVALSRQIGHYHNARFKEAGARFDHLTVLNCAGEGFFSEFSAEKFEGFAVERLASGYSHYIEQVLSGQFTSKVLSILDRLTPDLVVVPGWASAESFAAVLWARSNRVPVVVMAESQEDDVARSSLKERLKSHIVRNFDAALVGGYTTRDYLVRLGMPLQQIAMGYNAVDNLHFEVGAADARDDENEIRKRFNLPQAYFLASGRFIAKKNFPVLVQSYSKAHEKLGETMPHLVILGDGENRAQILAAIQLSGLNSRIHLAGFQRYDDLPVFYGLSRGFVHIPTREQWGLVINEAMASGVPVIASERCGATRTLMLRSQGGFVVDPFDQQSITEALVALSKLPQLEWTILANEAKEAVRDWGAERFGSGLEYAAKASLNVPRRGALPFWDKYLLNHLGSRMYTNVD